jgi:hypothetical protein
MRVSGKDAVSPDGSRGIPTVLPQAPHPHTAEPTIL